MAVRLGIKQVLTGIHELLTQNKIDHALIGGFGLSAHGVFRATLDIDFLVDETDKSTLIFALKSNGWNLCAQTDEVLHFDSPGLVDFLLARRPISRQLLIDAKTFGQNGIKAVSAEGLIGLKIQAYTNNPKREFKDKADIQALMEKNLKLDWQAVKRYADIFDQWDFIQSLKDRL